ncbi:Imm63 family immunity protein [Spirosoma pollinicola]|nr:Imm63 family immunity protein [Spirosoma pollinicola]
MTLSAIKEQVDILGGQINAPHHLYPTYGRSADGALPHIELDGSDTFHFVVVERGQELERRTTTALDDLLYWIFDTITFSMACTFELANRNHAQDFRRILFSHQEELLGRINVNWQERKRTNHNLTLSRHPFTDAVFNA